MNTITITGNISKDVEFRYTASGTPVVNFNLADNGFENGEKTVVFWDCFMFGENAERLANTCVKGGEITIKGIAVPNNYEKDGVKHYGIRIKAECFRKGRPAKSEKAEKQDKKE